MKTINFSCLEILPSLLDKSKTQTIRKAWGEVRIVGTDRVYSAKDNKIQTEEKPPKFKVEDKIKIVWKKERKYEHFCRVCGGEFKSSGLRDTGICKCGTEIEGRYIALHILNKSVKHSLFFNKVLGTGIIDSVFKIEMWKEKRYCIKFDREAKIRGVKSNPEDLAKRDGFSSAEQMFKTIDKMYDLSQPKQFFVYRWVWK